jgi:beta-1,2-mannobiose phosphorylase / 1,2-beta-oligomannan phosphorylase
MIFTPSKNNPILRPNRKHPWEALKVYNCGAIYHEKKFHLFYRAVGVGQDWRSVIGYAVSKDGVKFKRFSKPLLSPKGKSEIRGLEDPRITKIADKFYMTFATYDGITPRLSTTASDDLINWQRNGRSLSCWKLEKAGGKFIEWRDGRPKIVSQPNEWSKSGGVFPEKINGKYWMLLGEFRMWFAQSKNGKKWIADNKPFISPRKGNYFDNNYVEMGPPPIKTEKGWLVLYHGIDKKFFYRLGYLLLDLKNPRKIIYRSTKPIFSPFEADKFPGIVDIIPGRFVATDKMSEKELKEFSIKIEKPKVIFCNGAILEGDIREYRLRIYYGINDTYIGTATAKLKDILNSK